MFQAARAATPFVSRCAVMSYSPCTVSPSALGGDLRRCTSSSSSFTSFGVASVIFNSLCVQRRFVDLVSGTLLDTPSGRRDDPLAHPRFMKTYHRLDSVAIKTLEKLADEEEMQRSELAYPGYTTPEVQSLKKVVMDLESTTEDELRRTAIRLREILEEFCESASGDSGLINRSDCHHIRFIISLCERRLHQLDKAEVVLWDVLRDEPWNIDAVEGLLEIYVRTEEEMKKRLLPFLDHMVAVERADIVYAFLADFLLTAASNYFAEHGEGATTTYIYSLLATLAGAIGPQHMGLMVEFLFNSFDEIHYKSKFAKERDREFIAGLVVAFLKTLVARNIGKTTQDPIAFEFHILYKLLFGLRRLKRRQEAYAISERIVRYYRQTAHTSGRLKDDKEIHEMYRDTLLQYVEDRSLDAPEVARQLCIEAIEEFPDSAQPWRVLSAVLHRDRDLENAIVAAKKAVSIDRNNLASLALLANLFEATGRRTLSEETMERYKLLVIMQEQNASEEDIQGMMDQALSLEGTVKEDDFVAKQFEDITEHLSRLHASTLYSKEEPTAPLEDLVGKNLSIHRNPQLHTNMGDYLDLRSKQAQQGQQESPKDLGTGQAAGTPKK